LGATSPEQCRARCKQSSELTTEVYGKTTAFRGGKGFSPEAIQDAGMRPYAPLLKEPMSQYPHGTSVERRY
jgi:hypothetical protein